MSRATVGPLRYIELVTERPHENTDLIERVLGNDYLRLEIQRLRLEEDFDTGRSRVEVDARDSNNGGAQSVSGEGCGLVDAIMAALLSRYATEYQSLETVELWSFNVQARLDTKNEQSGADAIGRVTIEVKNSEGHIFTFSDESRSIASSTARAVLAVIEYFINSERAFIKLYRSLKDAQERHRSDLVTRYTGELAEVVKSTSYAQVIDNMLKDLEKKPS
jgi:hypothetical protein